VREALGVLEQEVTHPVDAAQKRHLDPADLRDGGEREPVGAPHEGVGGREVRRPRRRRGGALERLGDPGEERQHLRLRAGRSGGRRRGSGKTDLVGPGHLVRVWRGRSRLP
jgi:hypothetical protein